MERLPFVYAFWVSEPSPQPSVTRQELPLKSPGSVNQPLFLCYEPSSVEGPPHRTLPGNLSELWQWNCIHHPGRVPIILHIGNTAVVRELLKSCSF